MHGRWVVRSRVRPPPEYRPTLCAGYARLTQVQGALPGRTTLSPILVGLNMDSVNFKKPQINLTRLPTPVPSGEAEVGRRKPNDGDVVEEFRGEKPMEGVARTPGATEVDSDSSGSVSSVRSRRLWRRHSRSIDSCSLNFTSDTDEPAPKTQTTAGRGRERPPSVGKYVGLKQAQRERDKLKREEARLKAEKELEDRLKFVRSPMPRRVDIDEDRPVTKEDLEQCGNVVHAIALKSGNLKGTSQKALNWVTNKITQYIAQPESEIIARLEGEAKKWRENSARLDESLKRLQEENTALRRRLEDLEASSNKTSTEEMLEMIEARVQARVESALMGPAQRPSLAHEKKGSAGDTQLPVSGGLVGGLPPTKSKREKGKGRGKRTVQPSPPNSAPATGGISAPPQPIAGPSTAPDIIMAPPAAHQKKAQTKKAAPASKLARKKKGSVVQLSAEPRPLPPAPTSMETPWVVVASRKAKKGKPAVPPKTAQAKQQARRTEPKVRPPRSAAVVISLTPAAVAKGLSYKQVLTDAQTRVDLTGLDISRLRPKFAATGAPMYEVPGANSEDRADSLAAKLRECFEGSEDIRISRPTKTVELRLSELDYTATPETVAAALAKAGECSAEQIKVGQIRPDRSGVGTVWVKLPIKAAQKVKGAGRILIGWTAARVTVLESRPLRCFRCLESGHVRERCDCAVDRSELCYRCGQAGHKARECKAPANCAVCAAAGRPARHRLGGKACSAPSRRNRRRPQGRNAAAAEVLSQPQAASPPHPVQAMAEMEVEEIAHQ
ncbi:hypothetical protein O3G_MSEX013993 [Manduca sexta]|uniref:CCHC-type domain-containing protein n=1 Tax=Manduca sexta TaxID=7130 RepID=A0A921ZSN7_MANSE|nr:hypothetical protein O3G_MSEX013993 [Manduca sexta]